MGIKCTLYICISHILRIQGAYNNDNIFVSPQQGTLHVSGGVWGTRRGYDRLQCLIYVYKVSSRTLKIKRFRGRPD